MVPRTLLHALAGATRCRLVAEAVGTQDDIATVARCGTDPGNSDVLARPREPPGQESGLPV